MDAIPNYADNAVATVTANVSHYDGIYALAIAALFRKRGTDDYKLVVMYHQGNPLVDNEVTKEAHATRWLNAGDAKKALSQGCKEIREFRMPDVPSIDPESINEGDVAGEVTELFSAYFVMSGILETDPDSAVHIQCVDCEALKKFAV